ncbi:TetR/AcrR family transcriptional regulator [Phytohabitans houttuyneae]|uniref:DNA-binding protein n=1 Tax=Phytohabitans houttuyneae TaxID=1076126 RepID=A0A6V8JWW7_9ACTN|nr:TetR/AcrR family transcriptional regulator [Phytohabitans houttuyneae]GFJ77162.1 DNA-binding protein [Phytohabitans houttuyneae]
MTVPRASRRRAQPPADREPILRAATHLFRTHGYAATSIARVAQEAGVLPPAVFAAFTSKAGLLRAAVEAAAAFDDRTALSWVHDAPSAAEALRRYAGTIAAVAQRAYPIHAVAQAAADADPKVAELVADLDRQRLTGAGYIATAVAAKRGDADLSRVGFLRDTIWALNSPLLYGLLVHQRGWTVAAYRDWIATALTALAVPSPRQ